jgi:hypothetical protein
VKTIEGRRQGGTQKEVVIEILGCVEHSTRWYMKFVEGIVQSKPLNEIKTALIAEFKKPKSESQCIIELK